MLSKQFQLFPTHTYEAERSYEPEEWAAQPDVAWHSSEARHLPTEDSGALASRGKGFHTGTLKAARDRNVVTGQSREHYHPVIIRGSMSLPYQAQAVYRNRPDGTNAPRVWEDESANYSQAAENRVDTGLTVPYENHTEDAGSVSFRSPRENLHTWKESVLADKNSPTWARRQAEHGVDMHYRYQRDPGPESIQPPLFVTDSGTPTDVDSWEKYYYPQLPPKVLRPAMTK